MLSRERMSGEIFTEYRWIEPLPARPRVRFYAVEDTWNGRGFSPFKSIDYSLPEDYKRAQGRLSYANQNSTGGVCDVCVLR